MPVRLLKNSPQVDYNSDGKFALRIAGVLDRALEYGINSIKYSWPNLLVCNEATGVLMTKTDLFKQWRTFSKGMSADAIELGLANHLQYSLAKDQYTATRNDLYLALALSVRDRLVERWIRTQQAYYHTDAKRIYYLSAEYLLGRALVNNMINLGLYEQVQEALQRLDLDLTSVINEEPEPGLGNGGLGRLAACFLDSMATLQLPAYGYGIRYEFGIFEQAIRGLQQVECPDTWLTMANPWEIARPERSYVVRFYGRTTSVKGLDGNLIYDWVDTEEVKGIAYDTPISGYGCGTVNTLRLWAARATKEFDLEYFQHGDYFRAVQEKNIGENISKVLYPNDNIFEGQELRLKQQYFFVSCSIQDIIRRYLVTNSNFDAFPEKVAIQLNDTHPSLAIAELMRIFLDVYRMNWERSWDIINRTFAYTNHTLLAEALERWPVSMLEKLLPRHLEIIYEANRLFLRDVAIHYPGDLERLSKMSLIEEGSEKKVRMAHLAIVGSHSVNGVAALHTKLLMEKELKLFNEMFPGKFNNKTNGVTPRRWLHMSNRALSQLITERIGDNWVIHLDELRKLEALVDDADFRERFRSIKLQAKKNLTRIARELTNHRIDPDSIFDVQVKRIHEYKRQLLNILNIVATWLKIKDDPKMDYYPRTFIFGGKAAPSYQMAKLIIRLICHVGELINRDPDTRNLIKVIFLPNYRVTLAEKIFPASDVSEQISTAGFEASGTGNMKFALNGAVTIGTLDGANIEIKEEVGDDNIFIFGLTSDEVTALKQNYNPRSYYENNPILKRTIDLIKSNFFNPDSPGLLDPIIDTLLDRDPYMILADFISYEEAQSKVEIAYRDRDRWTKMAILNVARAGKFSSDRTICEYNDEIWHAVPVPIQAETDGNIQLNKETL
jgi:glycogen phosphorylase